MKVPGGAECMDGLGSRWVRFIKQYGPISRNDNMYDEQIRRSARRYEVEPLDFVHPLETELFASVSSDAPLDVESSTACVGGAGPQPDARTSNASKKRCFSARRGMA